jgi:transposase InsO family protein
MQKEVFEQEILLQEVLAIRTKQKRLGGRRLLIKLNEFMQSHAINMGRDAFFDLLSYNGLLIKSRNRKKPVTTNSYHRFKKYKNLISQYIPTAPNSLWVCDITYITLNGLFAYLSLITDAYSRKIVGFYLSKTLEAAGSIKALQMAIKGCDDVTKLIHHSDRGVQYCSNDYVKILQKNNIKISMTENGDPLENAIAERVNGILKDELLDDIFSSYQLAQDGVAVAVSIYNYERPHSSIEFLTPAEAHQKTGKLERKWKNYYQPKENTAA